MRKKHKFIPEPKLRIGVLLERNRAYGRRICEGVADYAIARRDWELAFLDYEDLQTEDVCDGYIARVINDDVASILRAKGRPVVDVYCGRSYPDFSNVDADHTAIGIMAARHFIDRKFTRFAYCGYDGVKFSDMRRDAFIGELQKNGFACDQYEVPANASRDFVDTVLKNEHIGTAYDARAIEKWIKALPKPVAVFCSHDLRAYHLASICRKAGLEVPNNVSILGVDDDTLICGFSSPMLSSVNPAAFEIGLVAAETLAGMLEDSFAKPISRKVAPCEISSRTSTDFYPIEPAWLSDALVYIRHNIANNITSADVCAHVKLSHTSVNAAFRAALNTSVQREIARLRIEEACRLLETTTLPVAEVAIRSGFSRMEYFCAQFSMVVKKTPSEYRRNFRTRHGHKPMRAMATKKC